MTVSTFEGWNSAHDWHGGPWRPQSPEQLAGMPPDVRRAYERAAEEYTFGVGFKRDPKTGKPIEQGIGSAGNMTSQARAAKEAASFSRG